MIQAFGLSDKGNARRDNEDRFAVHEDLALFVVADGMGGHKAGEVAAQMTVDAIVDTVRATASGERSDTDLLRRSIERACDQIRAAALQEDEYAGMGTTVVAARVADGRLSVAYVGDSRLYLLSRGRLRQVTQDDTWIASMLAAHPDADRTALEHHPLCHVLTNAVGAMAQTTVHVVEEAIEDGDVLVMTTDGVHDVMDEWRLAQLLLEADDPRVIAENLVRSALARGSRDNCTAVVARCM
ncbi:MAG TPA: protein phosphatase 2C domain-containing protein [Vicinamibacterales bacterium]|nr:protein phosphatase 2C domain-containing protein [Vicinamibacterales bacterium]